ncbi:Aldo/keto reductase [Dacryopinax primogenitus]|uniref:Aldo/keto reductase n=1 Tax=Dacryopinax primogenitus (strain DJM 731) TaxID=1858805 RepID=M5FX46_DACPD|nr:Aldo/keto reductase [Dacryopinax primogenitus]EJT98046.1 Aldo/keto reductase [Dacryopinax primogenitus]
MPTRKIGTDDVSAIGFGMMGLGGIAGPAGGWEERLALLDRVFELGCTFWDNANIYGDAEPLLGEWLRRNPSKRSKVFIATKFGFKREGQKIGLDLSLQAARECCERSLKILGVETIDLFYAHRVDPKVPVEVTVRAMAELVKEGKVRYIGLSECSASALRRAAAVHPIAAAQYEYAPITLDIEDPKIGVLKVCRELGIAVIPFSPLGKGVLTGQYKSPDEFPEGDIRRIVPRFSKENFPKILAVAGALREIGLRHQATPGQVALAWVLAQGEDFIPIPGTKSIKYLEENIGAAYVKLGPEEVEEIRRLARESGVGDALRMIEAHYNEFAYQDSLPLEDYKA